MPRPLPRLTTERTLLYLPDADHAPRMLDYYQRNKSHLEPWEPKRSGDFYTLAFWQRQLAACQDEYRADRGARFAIVLREAPRRVIGIANLSNIVRGAFEAAHLGYSIDADSQGRGLATEALEALLAFAFGELALHRVMANYQPQNVRSERVLERLGFTREGFARAYLFIDGAWRDHVLTSRIAPDAGRTERPGNGSGPRIPIREPD